MSNNYTHVSTLIYWPPDAIDFALSIYQTLIDMTAENPVDAAEPGYEAGIEIFTNYDGISGNMEKQPGHQGEPTLWISDDGGCVSLEVIADIISATMKQYDDLPLVAIEWANTCSRPRVGEFGGGAVLIHNREQFWMNTGDWLSQAVKDLNL